MKNTTTNVVALAAELSVLRTVCAMHRAKMDVAAQASDDAEIAFEAAWGYSPRETPDHAPGWLLAHTRYEMLCDDSGYFWTCSRVRDLEIMVEGSANGQRSILAPATLPGCCAHVVGLGDMPNAHAEVAPFIAQTLGYALAA
jgi:hypothetical protein